MSPFVLPPAFALLRLRLFRQPVAATATGPGQGAWRTGLRTALAVACVAAFIGLTWVRAESLATMMPGVLNLGLGVLTGLLGNLRWFS
jgi:hypothetical protein